MTGLNAAALASLAAWIEDRLGNEHADRQTICEDVAAQLRDMAAAVRESREPATAHLAARADDLGAALAIWATRDDSKPQPEVRQAANTAMHAIDAMLAELHTARAALVTEIRQSDDTAEARAYALLARLRHEFPGSRS